MESSDIISVVSVVIAIIAFIYTYITNTKKYELISQYRIEIIGWYSDTVSILMRLKCEALDGFIDVALKRELLSRLSANIEVGRFYFPNVDLGDNYGKEKPMAYRGYRNIVLEFLVYSYQIFEERDSKKYIAHIETLQRHFTSCVFEVIDPKSFLRDTKKYTSKTFSKDLSFHDYIMEDASTIDRYL